jgi:hypothetical protein
MTRRSAAAALLGALCIAALAETASAFTRREAICVRGARSRSRATIQSARDAARSQLQTDLKACLNDSSGCVGQCLAQQAACETGPRTAIRNCQNDICRVQNATATDACRDAADPVACVAQAQLQLFLCNQDCTAQSQAALIECSGAFNDCLQGCSNP